MNYKWEQIAERGQYEIGFINVYQLTLKKKAIAIIHFMPQHSRKEQRVVFTLILEGPKNEWTDGMINNIFEDAEACIRNEENFKFNNFNTLDYMDTQIFTIKKIEDFDYLSHGDFTFIK